MGTKHSLRNLAAVAAAGLALSRLGSQAAMLGERHWLLAAIVIGAVVFWLCTEYVAFYAAVVITVIIVVSLRVVSVRLDWTDPSFPGGDPPPEDP